jgi:hypothetical protein
MQIQSLGYWFNSPTLSPAGLRKYFPLHYDQSGNQGSIVSVVPAPPADNRGIVDRFPKKARDFFFFSSFSLFIG